MIQRIQSLFLLLSSASFWSLFALPFASSSSADNNIYQDLMLNLSDNVGLMGLCIAGGLLSLISIFLFNNRKLQSSLVYLVIVCSLGLGSLGYWLFSQSSIDASLGLGIAMPVLSLIMTILALTFISKDEKLVKSMDRLR